MQTQFRIVCATRSSAEEFRANSALGRSLALYPFPFLQVSLCPANTVGLPLIYNAAVRQYANDSTVFVFVHDDVHLIDYYWPDRLLQGLERFGVVGVAGNTRRVPRQPSWAYVDERFTVDDARHLSGAVAHGPNWPPEQMNYFGTVGREVKLLDGVLLAVRGETMRTRDLWFDERFDFHFYDLDFCRQAERAGVTLGTVPMPIVHQSTGNFVSAGWRRAYAAYLDKWGS